MSTPPCVVGADLDDLVARHRHRRRVGAVRGVGREHLVALVAVGLVEGAREQHAGQLAVRAGARLQRHVRQAGDLAQRALQLVHQLQRALGARGRLRRVQAGVAGQRRDALVQLRVVLHRARAERIEAGVEVEVALGDAVEVPVDLRLGDLGQARRLACGGSARAARRGPRGTSSSGGTNARRPSWDFSKIVVARSRCCGVSPAAAHAVTSSGRRARRASATARPSTSASRSMSARVRCSVIATSRPSSNSS